jgi:hypothetical protein
MEGAALSAPKNFATRRRVSLQPLRRLGFRLLEPYSSERSGRPLRTNRWHRGCSKIGMVSLIFLGLAIVCALISRILLLIAAINISAGWAFGVFLPFGPLFFRLNYPEEARNSYLFRVATLLCIFGFVVMRPGMSFSPRGSHRTIFSPQAKQTVGYAMEKPGSSKKTNAAAVAPTPSVEQRRAANAAELERLRGVEAELKLRKRDLLHSDTEGNRVYATDLASYNDALSKATAEKNALPSAK